MCGALANEFDLQCFNFESFHRHLQMKLSAWNANFHSSLQLSFDQRQFYSCLPPPGHQPLSNANWRWKTFLSDLHTKNGKEKKKKDSSMTQKSSRKNNAQKTTTKLVTLPFLWPTFHSGYVKWMNERKFLISAKSFCAFCALLANTSIVPFQSMNHANYLIVEFVDNHKIMNVPVRCRQEPPKQSGGTFVDRRRRTFIFD
jgi:hypothetical protein